MKMKELIDAAISKNRADEAERVRVQKRRLSLNRVKICESIVTLAEMFEGYPLRFREDDIFITIREGIEIHLRVKIETGDDIQIDVFKADVSEVPYSMNLQNFPGHFIGILDQRRLLQ